MFVPEVDPERVAGSLARRLGALGTYAFDVVGEMWARPELSRRDRSLIVVSTLAAQARDEELELHTGVALRNGLTRVEIEEIVVTVAAYAGFPAAMAASRRVDAALLAAESVETLGDRTPAAAKSDAERDRDGADVYKVVSGGRGGTDTTTDLAYLSDALGGVGVLAYRWAFGEIWARDELARRDRSLVVIAILVALGASRRARRPCACRPRPRPDEGGDRGGDHAPRAVLGVPRAVEAMRAAREAFARLDERAHEHKA